MKPLFADAAPANKATPPVSPTVELPSATPPAGGDLQAPAPARPVLPLPLSVSPPPARVTV